MIAVIGATENRGLIAATSAKRRYRERENAEQRDFRRHAE